MPLAITGQETVWYNVWRTLGLSDSEIRDYFTGPVYLPWHRMANIDSWNGPLPMEWLQKQAQLQNQILKGNGPSECVLCFRHFQGMCRHSCNVFIRKPTLNIWANGPDSTIAIDAIS